MLNQNYKQEVYFTEKVKFECYWSGKETKKVKRALKIKTKHTNSCEINSFL